MKRVLIFMTFRVLCSQGYVGIKLETKLFEINRCLTFWTQRGIAWFTSPWIRWGWIHWSRGRPCVMKLCHIGEFCRVDFHNTAPRSSVSKVTPLQALKVCHRLQYAFRRQLPAQRFIQEDGAAVPPYILPLFFLQYILIVVFLLAFPYIYSGKFSWKPTVLYGIHVIAA